MSSRLCVAALAALPMVASTGTAEAARINNAVAVFSGIDKITGRITTFDVYIGETVQFGALQVTPRVCYNRDDTEAQKITTFVEVDEITLDRKIRRIFTGWMFADSPGLNAVEHPVYDVWLQSCKATSDLPPPDTAAKQVALAWQAALERGSCHARRYPMSQPAASASTEDGLAWFASQRCGGGRSLGMVSHPR